MLQVVQLKLFLLLKLVIVLQAQLRTKSGRPRKKIGQRFLYALNFQFLLIARFWSIVCLTGLCRDTTVNIFYGLVTGHT